MADGDTVFNESRVRGRIIPLDSHNLGDKQRARQTVDREELARSMFEASLAEVETWPELDPANQRKEFEEFMKWKAEQKRAR